MPPSATPATQKQHVTKCYTCGAIVMSMSPSAKPRKVPRRPPAPRASQVLSVPHLPHSVDVTKCHACFAKKDRGVTATKRATRASPSATLSVNVTRRYRKSNANVTKCHACHAK